MASVNRQSDRDKKAKQNKILRFKWDSKMVGILLEALTEYKCKMEYNNSDFNADKTKQYEAVRAVMAERYFDVEVTFFGPKELDSVDEDNRESSLKIIDEQKKQIQKGYGRVMEKIKELRQGFSNAVVTGTRSGSGKLVLEYYDVMVQIWGGSPATKPLPFGVQSSQTENSNLLDESFPEFVEESLDTNVSSLDNPDEELIDGDVVPNDSIAPTRKRLLNQVPKLIDDKRKKMERQLSAAQRDKLFLQDEKEEKEFRRDLCRSLQESNAVFAESLKTMSSSMAILASTLQQQQQQQQQQNAQPSTMPMDPRTPIPLSGQQFVPTVFQHGNYIENQEMRVRCPASEQYTLSTDGRTYHKI